MRKVAEGKILYFIPPLAHFHIILLQSLLSLLFLVAHARPLPTGTGSPRGARLVGMTIAFSTLKTFWTAVDNCCVVC